MGPHPLIDTIVAGLFLAFIFGGIAHRLRISPIAGYLLAGVLVGPHTPGFVADQLLANELAEIGVILLMFGVGLHFSLKDLLSVRAIAIPGAIAQIGAATVMGLGLALAMGWTLGAGLVFGLALSVASTVVLLRALQERRLVNSERGRIAVGWLIVEDIAMVLALVLLPALVPIISGSMDANPGSGLGASDLFVTLAITLAKLGAFFFVMLVVGRRLIPWTLHQVAHTASRELFRLAVLSIALGVAFASAKVFGVSFALGAFFAGMILSESELSQQAAAESLPFRDAFAVLFFVSVGMLFDPTILIRDPWPVLGTLFIILFGKSIAAFAIVAAFRYPVATGLTISASLAQIGEFSFILAGLGVALGVLPEQGRDLIMAGAMLSIVINPLFFVLLDHWRPTLERSEAAEPAAAPLAPEELPVTSLSGHTVLIGYGRVGSLIGEGLMASHVKMFVIEENDTLVEQLRARHVEAISGTGVAVLKAANIPQAAALVVAIPDGFEAGQIVEQARTANPELPIIARAHSDAEVEHLIQYGANTVVLGEREIAEAMAAHLAAIGVGTRKAS